MGKRIRFTKYADRKLIARTIAAAQAGEHGRYWYQRANLAVKRQASTMGVCPDHFADVLAILSPRTSVKNNWRQTVAFFQGKELTGVIASSRRALSLYLDGEPIRGPKTEPFANALKGDLDAVVLDVWMARFFKCAQTRFGLKHGRVRYEHAIRRAAKELYWHPAEIQAAVWHHTVKQHGRTPTNIGA